MNFQPLVLPYLPRDSHRLDPDLGFFTDVEYLQWRCSINRLGKLSSPFHCTYTNSESRACDDCPGMTNMRASSFSRQSVITYVGENTQHICDRLKCRMQHISRQSRRQAAFSQSWHDMLYMISALARMPFTKAAAFSFAIITIVCLIGRPVECRATVANHHDFNIGGTPWPMEGSFATCWGGGARIKCPLIFTFSADTFEWRLSE